MPAADRREDGERRDTCGETTWNAHGRDDIPIIAVGASESALAGHEEMIRPRRPPAIASLGTRSSRARASAVRSHANLPAHVEHRTGRALGQPPRADVFSERHEQAVDLDP